MVKSVDYSPNDGGIRSVTGLLSGVLAGITRYCWTEESNRFILGILEPRDASATFVRDCIARNT